MSDADLWERLLESERLRAAAEAKLAVLEQHIADMTAEQDAKRARNRDRMQTVRARARTTPPTEPSVHERARTDEHVRAHSPSPSVSLLSPTPPYNSSTPPSPHTHSNAQTRDEARENPEPIALPDELKKLIPTPHDQRAVGIFLALCGGAVQQRKWIATLSMWLTGHDFPAHTKCTPELLGTSLREYDLAPGDYSAGHVKEFVLRIARQNRGRGNATSSGTSARAEQLCTLYNAHGFATVQTTDAYKATVRQLADDGVITEPKRFWRELQAVKPWTWLGQVRSIDLPKAHARIAEAIATLPAVVEEVA